MRGWRNIRERLGRQWGLLFLLVLALLYLLPYYYFLHHPAPTITEIYFADRITPAHRILINQYNQEHAGRIRVVPIDFPNPDFSTNERKEILARSLRGEGDGIDLLAVDVIWVQRFARWCEPLADYFTPAELDSLLPDALYSCYNDGKLVAVPLNEDQGVLYYREDLLRRLPGGNEVIRALSGGVTWEEFKRWEKTLRWKGPFYIFPAAEYEGLICVFTEILLSREPDYFTSHGFDFNTPAAREALTFFVGAIHQDLLTPPVVTTFTEVPSYRYYIRHDGLFIRGWNTYNHDFRESPVDTTKERYLRKVAMPRLPGGVAASTLGGWNLMVPRSCTKKEAVVDFVKFLLRPSSQETFYTFGGYYPVTSAFYRDPSYIARYPEINDLKRLMSTGVHRPLDRDYTRYSEIMARFISLALRNTISVDRALAEMTDGIKSMRMVAGVR